MATAMPLAEKVMDRLRPGCDRIEIAGSLRRGCKLVGDIEFLLIPKIGRRPGAGLFEEEGSLLDPILAGLVTAGKLRTVANGPKAKRFTITTGRRPIQLDIWTATPAGWGFQLAIRTGPADYSRHIVTPRFKGGALANGYKCHDGHVWAELDPVDCLDNEHEGMVMIDDSPYQMHPVPEEPDFFELIAGGWCEPNRRRYR